MVFSKGEGSHILDPEGNKYIDFLSAYSAVNQVIPLQLDTITECYLVFADQKAQLISCCTFFDTVYSYMCIHDVDSILCRGIAIQKS